MQDKELMENLLMLEKRVCDLYVHGAMESSSENVHSVFSTALNSSLDMQESIYSKMEQKGWYPTENVPADKIACVREKFTNC